jgi:DNA-binding transcriptional LysR family regulator
MDVARPVRTRATQLCREPRLAFCPLASFHEANGDIQLNLACSYEDVSFTSGYCDLDVRHGYAHWTDGEVKTLRNEFIAPLASEDYLERFPVRKPEDLLDRRLIFPETPLVQWQQWFGKFGVPVSRKAFDFSFDRSYMSLEAAALGHGIALESTMLASVHLGRGSLVPVFDRTFAVEVGAHHMVYPSQDAESPRCCRSCVRRTDSAMGCEGRREPVRRPCSRCVAGSP